MAYNREDERITLVSSGHGTKPSIDTNASGIAESAISFSAFPPPPTSIPSTPIRSGFAAPAPGSPAPSGYPIPTTPLIPRKTKGPFKGRHHQQASSSKSIHSVRSQATEKTATHVPRPPSPQTRASASNDWNDGLSSIDIDPAESRMLPTSFITSLLQENKDLRRANRRSYASDAFSGISEMTYPPPAPYGYRPEDTRHVPPVPVRFHGNPRAGQIHKLPPSAFNPNRKPDRDSSDSDTLHSSQNFRGVVPVSAYNRSGQVPVPAEARPFVVGTATATLQNIAAGSSRPPSSQTVPMSIDEKDVKYGFTGRDMDDDSILRYKAQIPAPHAQPEDTSAPHTSPAPRRSNYNPPQQSEEARQSMHSLAPSFMSRISMAASIRRILNWHKKPLPPVPRIPGVPVAAEREVRKTEDSTPLPDLVTRADALHTMLERGHRPHHSVSSHDRDIHRDPFPNRSDAPTPVQHHAHTPSDSNTWHQLRPQYYDEDFRNAPQMDHKDALTFSNQREPVRGPCGCITSLSRRTKVIILIVIVAIVAGIISAVVVVVKRSDSVPDCGEGITGVACNLDSTCVCTSDSSRCNPVAQNLIDLIPSVNEFFSMNITPSDVYNSLWYMQGSTSRGDCSPQSLVVDVGKRLSPETSPTRTRWTQAAMLWNVVQSQDVQATEKMKLIVQGAPWSILDGDEPIPAAAKEAFIATISGYIFDFAAQSVTPPTATFSSEGQPPREQMARVGPVSTLALDKVYTSAQASSIQQETALLNYWTTTLSLKSADLPTFKARLSVAPILLPFDATSSSIRNLFDNSVSSLFPPPLACYPGLSTQQRDQVNSLESSAFQLPVSPPTANFTTECYSDHPIYGVLNVLRLRLPFLDSRTGLPRQAAVLRTDSNSRVVMYAGERLSGVFPSATAVANSLTSSQTDPRQFGTLGFSNHVVLRYLTSMPVATAISLVEFVLESGNRAPIPPDDTSLLMDALATIPVLEVAVFGSIRPSDVSGTVSAFTTSSDSMFYGSEAGAAFRSWSIDTYGGRVVWAENATAPRVVRDNSFGDEVLQASWQATSASINQNSSGILDRLVASLESTGKFTIAV